MGQAERVWMEAEERGWSSPEGHVCESCVDDDYLKHVISQNLVASECDFCGASSDEDIAAPVEVLMPSLAGAVHHFFNDPTSAGVPWDDGPVFEGEGTIDMLMSLPLECNDELFEVVSAAFTNTDWVPAAGGHFASTHDHKVLNDSWGTFVHAVKHETRFHFHRSTLERDADWDVMSPGETLSALGRVSTIAGLVRTVEAGKKLYRARTKAQGESWVPDEQSMGAPPKNLARAGRMNPAGISYLYCALEPQTAAAEIVSNPPLELVMASYEAVRDLRILDLFNMPDVPSIIDDGRRHTYEPLLFLHRFVEEVCRPVSKNGGEHIDYVPSQVVCEWFSHVFSPDGDESQLDGLMYPECRATGGMQSGSFPKSEQSRGRISSGQLHEFACSSTCDMGRPW